MSVDYESVLIYGYKIPAKDVKRIKKQIGLCKWDVLRETYDGSNHYEIIRENSYQDDSDYYFGVVLGREIDLDSIDAICWFEYETDAIDKEFENAFGYIPFAEAQHPMMYHFVRVY